MTIRMISMVLTIVLAMSGCHGSVSKSVQQEFAGDHVSPVPVRCDVRSYIAESVNIKFKASYHIHVPPEKVSDLEHLHYVKLLGRFLNRHGWTSAPFQSADYVVVMNFDIDEGRSEYRSYNMPTYGTISGGGVQHHSGTIYGSTGRPLSYSGQTWTPPTHGQTGTRTVTQSYRVYTRHLVLDVINRSASETQNTSVVENTIKVRSEGSAGEIATVMPFLMDNAMDFLGRQGSGTRASDRVFYFSSSMDEARQAIGRVTVENLDDLLIFSAQNGDLLTVRAMLEQGVNPNTTGGKKNRPALHWAIHNKHAAVVLELVKSGATVDPQAIAYARTTRQHDLEKFLQSRLK